jgi:DHA1 family bicyclomycin/chloramphenicol resistance-like MFS transporter
MMLGAALSNRFAGVLTPRLTVKIGFSIMGVALAADIAYALLVAKPSAPWAVLPITLYALGNSLMFPVLQIKMLDRYPTNRGAASSMQAFLWGLATAAVASFLAPVLWGSVLHLAIGATVLGVGGFLSWLAYALITPVERDTPVPQSLGDVEEPLM